MKKDILPGEEVNQSIVSVPEPSLPPSIQTVGGGAATAVAPTQVLRQRRPVQIRMPFDIKKVGSIAFVIVVAGFIWWMDGFFTLQFINGKSGWLAQFARTLQWLLPWGVTVGTLYLWPSKAKRDAVAKLKDAWLNDQLETSYQRFARARKSLIIGTVFWLGLQVFNIGTSTTGVVQWGDGREVDLFGGFTLPDDGTILRLLAIFIGALGAFAPEQLMKWAETEWNQR